MTLVRIEIIRGHSAEYKTALLRTVHKALAETLGIPDADRCQRLHELDPACFERGPGATDSFTAVEVTLPAGYGAEAKRRAVRAIADQLGEQLGIPETDVVTVLGDQPPENWGLPSGA